MLLSHVDYTNLENVGVVLADDICEIANSKSNQKSNNFATNNYLSMDYLGFFKNNQHIAHLMNIHLTTKYIIYNQTKITPLQLLHLIERSIGKVILHKHAKSTHHVEAQSLL